MFRKFFSGPELEPEPVKIRLASQHWCSDPGLFAHQYPDFKNTDLDLSVNQCCRAGAAGAAEAAGAATFRAAPELEPIFLLVGAGSDSLRSLMIKKQMRESRVSSERIAHLFFRSQKMSDSLKKI